jgi:hypothetical protein
MSKFRVYYTKTRQGCVDIKADDIETAQNMVANGDFDDGDAVEYDEPLEAYAAEKI